MNKNEKEKEKKIKKKDIKEKSSKDEEWKMEAGWKKDGAAMRGSIITWKDICEPKKEQNDVKVRLIGGHEST